MAVSPPRNFWCGLDLFLGETRQCWVVPISRRNMLVLPLQLGLWLSLADRRHHGPQHDTETLTCASSQPRACVRQSGERHLVPRPEQQFWTVFLIESQIIRNRCRQLFVATNGPTSTLYCSYNPLSHAGSRRQVAARRATPPLLPVHCWPGSFLELMTRLGYDKFAVQGRGHRCGRGPGDRLACTEHDRLCRGVHAARVRLHRHADHPSRAHLCHGSGQSGRPVGLAVLVHGQRGLGRLRRLRPG